MLVAHVVATVADRTLLAYGERLLATLPALLLAPLRRWADVRRAAPLRPPPRLAPAAPQPMDRLVVGRPLPGGPAGAAPRRSRALTDHRPASPGGRRPARSAARPQPTSRAPPRASALPGDPLSRTHADPRRRRSPSPR